VNVRVDRRDGQRREQEPGERVPGPEARKDEGARPLRGAIRERHGQEAGDQDERRGENADEAAGNDTGRVEREAERRELDEARPAQAPRKGSGPPSKCPQNRDGDDGKSEDRRTRGGRRPGDANARGAAEHLTEEDGLLKREDSDLGEKGDEKEGPEPRGGAGRLARLPQTFLMTRHAFVPPKPNEFDIPSPIFRSRAVFGV